MILITGLNGTLAPHVANEAKRRGYNVSGWDRHAVPPEDEGASHAWLIDLNPQAIVHLAMGSESWAGQLARFALMKSIPFVFTSTAMVFDHVPDGPHAVDSVRTAQDEYGRYKIRCEDSIRNASSHAMVVRIGWQIDPDATGNNMLCALDDWQAREGCVAASRAWKPACSFMTDTALALIGLVDRPKPGVMHLDSNATEGHTFDQIVAALQHSFWRTQWHLRVHEEYVHDQRLKGGEELVPGLSTRLPSLRSKM
jgi:dTDP-4-dehydrorhamnose reductase